MEGGIWCTQMEDETDVKMHISIRILQLNNKMKCTTACADVWSSYFTLQFSGSRKSKIKKKHLWTTVHFICICYFCSILLKSSWWSHRKWLTGKWCMQNNPKYEPCTHNLCRCNSALIDWKWKHPTRKISTPGHNWFNVEEQLFVPADFPCEYCG